MKTEFVLKTSIWNCVLVDDVRAIRHQMRRWLTESGFDCAEANSGDNGWELIQSSVPDLVITDIEMPAGSGFDLVRSIRGSKQSSIRDIPVMAVSSLQDIQTERSMVGCGANTVLLKPLEKLEFILAAFQTMRGETTRGRSRSFSPTIQRLSPLLRRFRSAVQPAYRQAR